MTKMNWSGPNVINFGIKSQFGPFWSRPNHYGQVQINLVRPKPFWTDRNSFGHKEGQGTIICFRDLLTFSVQEKLLKFEAEGTKAM